MTLQKTPCTCLNLSPRSLVAKQSREKKGTAIPAMGGLDGGEGGVEEHEGDEGYL